MKVVWSPRAVDRVAAIARYIAADRPAAATTWVDRVFARVERLAMHPAAGRRVPELSTRRDVREVLLGAYRVLYRVDRTQVVVLTVRHAARQFDEGETT